MPLVFLLVPRKNLAVTICSLKNAGGDWSLEQYLKTADIGSDGLLHITNSSWKAVLTKQPALCPSSMLHGTCQVED